MPSSQRKSRLRLKPNSLSWRVRAGHRKPSKPVNLQGDDLLLEATARELGKQVKDLTAEEIKAALAKPAAGEQVSAIYREYQDAKREGYKGTFQQYQNEDANRKRPVTQVSLGGMNPAVASAASKLRDDFRADSKDFASVAQAYNRIRASGTAPSAAGDLALIFNYMKILDPGSTVREGEFATAQNAAGAGDRIRAAYNRIVSGERLAPTQRADFLDRSRRLYDEAHKMHRRIEGQYREKATSIGADPKFVITDYGVGEDEAPKAKVGDVKFLPDGRKVKVTGFAPDGSPIVQVMK
jgi:hypothetical protein